VRNIPVHFYKSVTRQPSHLTSKQSKSAVGEKAPQGSRSARGVEVEQTAVITALMCRRKMHEIRGGEHRTIK
jgi:hypothetical protein